MVRFEPTIPIYLQVMDEIKAQIVSGKLKPGQQLPSVRELAQNIQVNPNTIARAYQELERAGSSLPAEAREPLSGKRKKFQ